LHYISVLNKLGNYDELTKTDKQKVYKYVCAESGNIPKTHGQVRSMHAITQKFRKKKIEIKDKILHKHYCTWSKIVLSSIFSMCGDHDCK